MGLFRKKYTFDPERYRGTFIGSEILPTDYTPGPVPHVVYCFWTGDNEMTPNRVESLSSMKAAIGVPVKLITPADLGEYIVDGHPLHPSYQFLSLNHRSDYLRCYFMHHHGGGYCDIKRFDHSWERAFSRLDRSDKWLLGYREIGKRGVGGAIGGAAAEDMSRNWRLLIGNGAFICRPGTPFTCDWYAEVQRTMDYYYESLKLNPGNMWGSNEGYPIPWPGVQGNIFHPLCLKYHDRLLQDNRLKPSFKDYR